MNKLKHLTNIADTLSADTINEKIFVANIPVAVDILQVRTGENQLPLVYFLDTGNVD